MITVQDMLDYALEIDLSHLAHSIYWALCSGQIGLHDDSEKLKGIEFDDAEIKQLMEQNALDVGKVKLFVMDAQDGWFAFYLAEHSLDAYRLHDDLFRTTQSRITRADRLMLPMMTFAETGMEESLYDYRKRIATYPVYAGHARAGERVLHRMTGRG